MSGSTPLIDQITFASSQKEVIVNRVNNANAPAATFGIKTLVGLSLVLYGGPFDVAGTPTIVANQTIALSDNTTNYVKRDAAGVVTKVTVAPGGWPAGAAGVVALYTIVTSGGVYTSITEWRVCQFNAGSSFTGGTLTSALNYAPTVTIASSATPAIGAAASNYISITGVVTITGFDTIAAGAERAITFTGALLLTHNGTSLILPTAANITTVAGDSARFMSLGSGNWKCLSYTRADGTALAGGASSALTVLTPAYAGTVTVDLTGITVPLISVEVGTLTGNITLNITNGTNGQRIEVLLTQDGSGNRLFTAGGNLRFSTDVPSPTLSTAINKVDALLFRWHSSDGKAWLRAINKGY